MSEYLRRGGERKKERIEGQGVGEETEEADSETGEIRSKGGNREIGKEGKKAGKQRTRQGEEQASRGETGNHEMRQGQMRRGAVWRA